MKRDFDLIRSIMLIVEAAPANTTLQAGAFAIDGHDEPTTLCHIEVLIDAGMLYGKAIMTQGKVTGCMVRGLTWCGFEFLDAVKNESVWSKLKEMLEQKAISMPYTVLAETAKALLSAAIPKLL